MVQAGEVGVTRVRAKMAQAVELSRIVGRDQVAEALGKAAESCRFAEGDLESIVKHRASSPAESAVRVSEEHSLQAGTAAWGVLGQ